MPRMKWMGTLAVVALGAGCGGSPEGGMVGVVDAGPVDGAPFADAAPFVDARPAVDAADGGAADARVIDARVVDAPISVGDAAVVDAAVVDARVVDAVVIVPDGGCGPLLLD